MGFCMGVKRAVELAAGEAKAAGGNPVFTLGPLIHNPKVLDDLRALGIRVIEDISSIADHLLSADNCTVIIRAHGISPRAEEELRGKGFRIVDATCPKVKASQLKTRELSRAGCSLFLAGEENIDGAQHAEIAGLLGYCEESALCAVVISAKEAEKAAASLLLTNPGAKTALLGQTTICEEEYRNIGFAIKKYFPNLEIIETICAATAERQKALRELLTCTDAVLIAGSRASANTRRLLAIASKFSKESGAPCALVENPDDIPAAFRNYKTIGLCAGASAPDSLVDEIEKNLLTFMP